MRDSPDSPLSVASRNMQDKISPLFSRWEEIECVYLFGENCDKVDFPLNFGIFLSRPLSTSEIEKMRTALMNDLEEILNQVVDCIVLQEVHPLFIREILKKGERVYGSLSPSFIPSIPDFEKGVCHER